MWKTVKLSEICEIQPPKKEVKNILEDDSKVSYMGMDLLGIDKMYANPEEVRSLSSVYKGYTYFAENDVLLAKITPCFENGKLGVARGLKNGVGFGSSEFVVFRCKENILPNFLYYFLNQKSFREEGKKNMSGAVGHKRVTKEFIANSLISLPPLKKQQTIVAKLDTAFAEIKKLINLEKNKIKIIEKLKVQILNSKLNNLNNVYKKTNIGEICELAYGKGLDKSDRKEDSGFPAFGANGIKYFATKYLYDKPSIIVGRKGSAGELKYVKEPFWALDVTYYTKHNSELVNLKYLYYLLKLQNLPSFAKGVKPGINRNEVYSIPILLPTLERQKIIAKEIDNAFKQFEIINKLEKLKLENYEKLKTSLLNDKLQSKVA